MKNESHRRETLKTRRNDIIKKGKELREAIDLVVSMVISSPGRTPHSSTLASLSVTIYVASYTSFDSQNRMKKRQEEENKNLRQLEAIHREIKEKKVFFRGTSTQEGIPNNDSCRYLPS